MSKLHWIEIEFSFLQFFLWFPEFYKYCICVIGIHGLYEKKEELSSEKVKLINLQIDYALHFGMPFAFELEQASHVQMAEIILHRLVSEYDCRNYSKYMVTFYS